MITMTVVANITVVCIYISSLNMVVMLLLLFIMVMITVIIILLVQNPTFQLLSSYEVVLF